MKSIKHPIAFSFIFLLILSMPLLSEKRDLSTPESRLLGHWEDIEKIQYYFGPLDSNTRNGSLILVIPDSRKLFEKWIAQDRSNRYAIGWSGYLEKELDKVTSKETEKKKEEKKSKEKKADPKKKESKEKPANKKEEKTIQSKN